MKEKINNIKLQIAHYEDAVVKLKKAVEHLSGNEKTIIEMKLKAHEDFIAALQNIVNLFENK